MPVITESCSVLDTLVLARRKHPGKRNNLDALCDRYAVDNSRRDKHGALLDAEILAEVYLAMTGGQTTHAYNRLESICLGLGIEKEHFHIINPAPKNREKLVSIIKKEIEYNGPSVIVPTRECIQSLRKRSKKSKG